MKDVQNRERTVPAKPLVAIGELQFDYISSKNDRSNKKNLFRPLEVFAVSLLLLLTQSRASLANQNILIRFHYHSNLKLNNLLPAKQSFPFNWLVLGLPSNKANPGEILIKIFKESGFTFEYLTSCFNEGVPPGKFPDSFTESNVVPVHKKKDPTDACNYRPVGISSLKKKKKK